MSGFSLADVIVHRNSAEPARLGALAFTRGAQIHLAAGQERQLPHEAWHVVQQKQGRVKPATQLKGIGLNQDSALEREADEAGSRAASRAGCADADKGSLATEARARPAHDILARAPTGSGFGSTVQRKVDIDNPVDKNERYTAYSEELDRRVKALAPASYILVSRRLKARFKEGHTHYRYFTVADAVKSVEDSLDAYKEAESGSKVALKFAQDAQIKSTNKDNEQPDTRPSLRLIRSPEFQQGLERAMRPLVLDYVKDKPDYVKSNVMGRINAYASQYLKAGNCGEFSELVFWKMMEVNKKSWVGQVRLYPDRDDTPPGPFDHAFNIVYDKAFPVGHKPAIGEDAIVVDAWGLPDVTTLGEFYDKKNPYSVSLTADNLFVIRVEKTVGYDLINKDLSDAAAAAIKKYVADKKAPAEEKKEK